MSGRFRFRDPSLALEERVADLLAQLTLDEKLSLCAGENFWQTKAIPRLGIPRFAMSDGPRGIGFHCAFRRGTAFPCGIALAASWDTELAERFGAALGEEARRAGARMVLAPAINICRTPLNGRTFEYFTEDPHLNARLAAGVVRGIQSQRVAACAKHFAVNNQETDRMRVSAEIGERALREIYLPAFEACVREADAWAVMAAYNAINGVPACENGRLLNDVLRTEYGFSGFVVSDWFAARRTASAAACIDGGLSLEMPGKGSKLRTANLQRALAEGRIDAARLDRNLAGLLRTMFRTGHLEEPSKAGGARIPVSTPANQLLAREIAAAGIVLLKNERQLLPLDLGRLRTIALTGPKLRKRNCLPLWGGSSGVWPPHEVTPWQGLRERVGGRAKIVTDPARADVAVLVVGLSHRPGADSEIRDRKGLALPARQEALIRRTLRANPDTVVVIVGGSPISMDWADEAAAIVHAWYPGMEGGHALAGVLFGDVNPSGKLPVSFPRRLQDSPAHASPRTFPGDGAQVHYDEGVFVGYRHFDTHGVEPLFAFGHGLSYTQFRYDGLRLDSAAISGEQPLAVALDVSNVGSRPGAEVVQLYVRDRQSSVARPAKELKAFRKIHLAPGASGRVEFSLSRRDLSFYCEQTRAWRAEPGSFEILVGSSSRDIRLAECFELLA
jgi:beta-glucosidase